MREKILFDVHASTGHIHATLKMARLLKDAGYQVVYALTPEYCPMVEKQGFSTCIGKLWPDTLHELKLQKLIGKTPEVDELSEMRCFLNKINPDLIIVDEFEGYKAIFYQILNFTVVVSQSMPDPAQSKGIPPFTSYRLPASNVFNGLVIELLWMKRIAKFWLLLSYSKIKTGCNDAFSQIARIAKRHDILFYHLLEVDRCSSPGIRGVPRLIISPKAFDFQYPEKKDVYRIGPLVDIYREGKIDHPRYRLLFEYIARLKSNDSGNVIYVSMGTVSNYDIGRCTRFIRRIAKVAQWHSNDLFVLSTGKFFDTSQLLPIPDNMIVFETVPQVDLLQKCDIMITHGGMNSITECVFCGVPMLVYPLSRKWDQPGNSARVVFHQIGLRGRIERDSAKRISKKINQLIGNYQFYKDNVLKMRTQFELKNQSTEVVNIIESIMNNHAN